MPTDTPSFAEFLQNKTKKADQSGAPSFANFLESRQQIPKQHPLGATPTPPPVPQDWAKNARPVVPSEAKPQQPLASVPTGTPQPKVPGVLWDRAIGTLYPEALKNAQNILEAPQKYVIDPLSKSIDAFREKSTTPILGEPPFEAGARSFVIGTGTDITKQVVGLLGDPKNWPFLMSGAAEVRPVIKVATTALFTAMQQTGAWDEAKAGNYADAAIQEAFSLLGLAHLPSEVKSFFAKQTVQASKSPATLEPTPTPAQAPPTTAPETRTPAPPESPLDTMAKQGPAGERTALRARESALNERLRQENAKSDQEHRLAQMEADRQAKEHDLRLKAENAKTDAEKAEFAAQLKENEDAHQKSIEAEQARFKRESPGVPPPEPPAPEKRPFQEPGQIIRGRQPLTREEREQERVDERARQVREDLAAEKQRRADIGRKAFDQTREADLQRLREGQGFTTVDRRTALEPPPDVQATQPQDQATRGPGASLEPPPSISEPTVRDLERHEDTAVRAIMEDESRKGQAQSEEEVARIDKEIEENKKLLEDVRADKKAAEVLSGKKEEKVRKAGAAVEGVEGNEAILKTVTRDVPIRYKVVEGASLKPSHDPNTFQPNNDYPEGVQERDYKGDKDAQVAVISHAQAYDPSFTVSDAPGPEHGPPIVTPDGVVLGGNSRHMSTMRLYGSEEGGDSYKNALLSKAGQFGLNPDDIRGMKEPVLVREVKNPPRTIPELRALGSDLNRVFTRKLSEYEQAVSAGKRISQETLDYVGSQLAAMGEGSSLRDLLRDRSQGILEKFDNDGIIAPTERRAFIDEQTGVLNEAGKDFIERALLGAVIDNASVLANTPPGILGKLERALAPLARIKARGEPWDVTDYLKEALREHRTARSKGISIDEHLNPPTMAMFPREPVHPITEALARKVDEASAAVKKAFENYADDSEADVKNQGTMFFEPPKPWDSFNKEFQAKVREDEWGTIAPKNEASEESVPVGTPQKLEPPPAPAQMNRATLRSELIKKFPKVSEPQVDAALALIDARAKVKGVSPDEWIKNRFLRVESPERAEPGSGGNADARAQVKIMEDGRAILRAFSEKNPNLVALVHELGHIFRQDLNFDELQVAGKWVGGEGWDRTGEEKFARGFERYIKDGVAPSPEMDGVFSKLKTWLGTLYKSISRNFPKISPDMKRMFDRMFTGAEGLEKTPEAEVKPQPKEPSFGNFLSVKGMSDEDLQLAKKSLDEKINQPGLSQKARQELLKQVQPFDKELKARGKTAAKPADKSVLFPKTEADAAKSRLLNRKPPITLNYTDDEDQTINDMATYMGHLFENGYRDFDSASGKVTADIGDWVKPYARTSWNKMLTDGKVKAQQKLQRVMPEPERQKYSQQLGLFETHEAKNRRIELPPGSEVRHEAETAQAARPELSRKEADARNESQRRPETRPDVGRADQPGRGDAQSTPGRSVRGVGQGGRVAGVTEVSERPLRNVPAPQLDVPFIPSTSPSVEPATWKANLKAANLPEDLPPPTATLTPSIERKLIFKGQPEIVQTALTSLQKYKSFVLASATGTGKTFTGSAIIAERNPRFGLILAPPHLTENWIETAQNFGLDVRPLPKSGTPTEPGIYIEAYTKAGSRPGMEKHNWDLVLADESHKGRRWHADTGTGRLLKAMAPNSSEMVYTSATPFHSALELGYMDKLGLWKNQGLEKWLRREFNTYKSEETGNWVSPFNPRKMAALRQELISRGMMVNLDRDMRGYGVNFAFSPLSGEQNAQVRNIAQAFKLAEEYFRQRNAGHMIQAVRGNAVTFMKSYLERARLPEAIELGKKLEKEGWKVAYFTETKKEVPELYNFLKPADQHFSGEISRLLPKLPGVVDSLKEAFGDDIANFSGPHGVGRQEELDAFNRGDKKHIIATYGAGGLGVSMHDTSGTAPRAAIYIGPPWSGVTFDQAIGRPWRFGAKSNVESYFLTSNAKPEMNLMIKKILPRFESLKASISGIQKEDPIVAKMKDLDAAMAYQEGDEEKNSAADFMQTVDTRAITPLKEARVSSAEDAKNKGMQVERRLPLESPETLNYKGSEPPPDLGDSESTRAKDASEAAKAVRRPYVPIGTEKEITDPRILDFLERANRSSMGIPAGEAQPPKPPDEIIGEARIPPPGRANVEYDLANPKLAQWAHESVKDSYPNLADDAARNIVKFERGIGAIMAQVRSAPMVLNEFESTKELPKNLTQAEMRLRRRVATMRVDANKIIGDIAKNEESSRRVFEALQESHDPERELRGASSKWTKGNLPFTPQELRAAQRLRNEILNPIIDAVQDVRPDVGRRYKYAPLMRQIDELTPQLYPELNGKIPADLIPDFSLEVRQSLTKDPFSPHTLKRSATPPKTIRIEEAMDAYIPSMLRVAELTPESRKTAIFLSKLPDSVLKDYAKKYARIFFGVPGEYKNLDSLINNFSRAVTNLTYSAALDLNPGWFVLHSLKVPFNVWPELGEKSGKYVVKGYAGMTSPEGRELVARSGVLMDTMWRVRKPRTAVGKTFSKILHSGMTVSDTIDRGVAYLGGLEKAKDKGLLGDPDHVGKITWTRLNELAAEGVDVHKALDYAYGVVARSNFMFTNAYVQPWVREYPMAMQFKSFVIRQTDFFRSTRRLAKEAKAQSMEPREYAAMKAAKGEYEYMDAVSKYRRLLFSTVIAGVGGITLSALGISQRVWPYHLSSLISSPFMFAERTVTLLNKIFEGKVTEREFVGWLLEGIGTFGPGMGSITRGVRKDIEDSVPKAHRKPSTNDFGLEPPPGP